MRPHLSSLVNATLLRMCGLLLLFPGASTAAAVEPDFTVTASADGREVAVVTPAGIHVNAKAPLTLQPEGGPVLPGTADTTSGDASWTLPETLAPGAEVRLDFSLCDDAETWCKIQKIAFDFDGAISTQAVRVATGARPQAPGEPAHAAPGHLSFAIQDDPDLAFERAQAEDKLVLLDFHAVWCPPCQMMAAEGFVDPRVRPLLDALVVLQLDADQPTSWSTKSRYDVRGYPTVILARPDGQELARLVGYPGADELLRWLERGVRSRETLRELAEKRGAGDRSPETLTALARALADIGLTEEAAALYREALPQLSGPAAVEARVALLFDAAAKGDKRAVKAQLKALNAVAPTPPQLPWWILEASQVAADTQLMVFLFKAGLPVAERVAATPGAPAAVRADAHEARATFLSGLDRQEEAVAAASAAADAWLELVATFPGTGAEKFATFRGQARSLTSDLRDANRPAEADALHRELIAAFPHEVTYFYDYARFLKDQARLPEAEAMARSAVAEATGDNLYWATGLLADILVENGKTAEATTLLRQTLDGAALPDDPTVRTHRYVKRLQEQLERLETPSATHG